MTTAAEARLETLLTALRAGTGRRPAEEIVRQLTDLYGEGLARIVAVLREDAPVVAAAIAADDVVAGLLVLHDLHPLDAGARVRRAVDRLGGEVRCLGTDGGVARVLLGGGCSAAARPAVEAAVRAAAPEITRVEFVAALYQIGMGPPPGRAS